MRRDPSPDPTSPTGRNAVPTDPVTRTERPTPSRHGPIAQLLIALSPLSVILLAYAAASWINAPLAAGHVANNNRLGFGLHVSGPAEADRAVFGAVPSVWLQAQLIDGSAHWYDAAAALIYVTHVVAIPLVTGIVWFWLRGRFTAWIVAVLTFTAVGVSGYIVYPAQPPWLASQGGEIGAVTRYSTVGWDYLHLDLIATMTAVGQAGSNPVAAMPSLHAGAALLITLFLWPVVTALSRSLLLVYVILMALTLIYTGEHYVVDVIVGWLTAGIGIGVAALARHHPAPDPDPSTRRGPGPTDPQ